LQQPSAGLIFSSFGSGFSFVSGLFSPVFGSVFFSSTILMHLIASQALHRSFRDSFTGSNGPEIVTVLFFVSKLMVLIFSFSDRLVEV
jgi:hypothetical protein